MNFTERAYKALIASAANRFQFIRFCAELPVDDENIALWRHDIDFSPQRALALAKIEADFGVVATYYVQLSSRFYSVFEPETCAVLKKINHLGHDIGLHFDAEVLGHQDDADYESRIKFEANVLEQVLETKISSFTLHNPTTIVGFTLDSLTHAGLTNGSASAIRDHFEYCSDSNGIWRFRTLYEVVEDETVVRLYALTHPEWWQSIKAPPRARVQRCIDGRAKFCGSYYDRLLETYGRKNVRI